MQKGAFFSVTCGGGPAKRERISESAFFGGETEVRFFIAGSRPEFIREKEVGGSARGEKGKTR